MPDTHTDVPDNQTGTPGPLAELVGEVAMLRDLFQRRLLDDRQKKGLYDALYEQLETSRAGFVRQVVEPVLREIILVLDRLDRVDAVDDGVALLGSVREELLDVLARRGVEPIAVTSGAFDSSTQEVVGVIDVEDPETANTIAHVQRPGYRSAGSVLRPTQVVVHRFTS